MNYDAELIRISTWSSVVFRAALEVELLTHTPLIAFSPWRITHASVRSRALMRLAFNDERDFVRSHATWTNSLHHARMQKSRACTRRRERTGGGGGEGGGETCTHVGCTKKRRGTNRRTRPATTGYSLRRVSWNRGETQYQAVCHSVVARRPRVLPRRLNNRQEKRGVRVKSGRIS